MTFREQQKASIKLGALALSGALALETAVFLDVASLKDEMFGCLFAVVVGTGILGFFVPIGRAFHRGIMLDYRRRPPALNGQLSLK